MATPKNEDLGQAEVQSKRDEARKQGYEGTSASTHPNSAFSLASGPDSPSAAEQLAAIAQQRADQVKGDR